MTEKIKLLIELEVSEDLLNTSLLDEHKILEGNNGLLLLHSNTLGCVIGKVIVLNDE